MALVLTNYMPNYTLLLLQRGDIPQERGGPWQIISSIFLVGAYEHQNKMVDFPRRKIGSLYPRPKFTE